MAEHDQKFSRLAINGVAWSIAQNWGGRAFTFVLFVVLARFLSPTEFGLVAAAVIVLNLVTVMAEFGFGDAIVQRPDYEPADANLPFYVAMASSVLLAVVAWLLSGRIEAWLDVPGLAPIVGALCVVAPITTMSQFQEANYRRAFAFRKLAMRVFIASLVAGLLAVLAAVLGFGVWSLVVQTYVNVTVGMVWLWLQPAWRPGLEIRPRAFAQMARYGLPIAGNRLLDFAATRIFETVLLGRYGIAAFGLYAVGFRLYQIMMQLLQTAFGDVSLTLLSRVSHDRERMAGLYKRALTLAALVCAPIFVGTAAVIPEVTLVLFGNRWAGVEDVSRPLLLLGALQSVQFLNGPFLSARGRTGTLLGISILKNSLIAGVAFVVRPDSMASLVSSYAAIQLFTAPFAFGITSREVGLPAAYMIRTLFPFVAACAISYSAVQMLRPYVAAGLGSPLSSGLCLGMVFLPLFVLTIAILDYRHLTNIVTLLRSRGSAE